MSIPSMSIYMTAGMTAKIEIPIGVNQIIGHFPYDKSVEIGGQERQLTRGFVVENTEIGTIAETEEKEVAVIYTHKKNARNNIYFYGINPGTMLIFTVDHIGVHDHASVYTGGPAYGTYYSEL